jgi:hypothetical protein
MTPPGLPALARMGRVGCEVNVRTKEDNSRGTISVNEYLLLTRHCGPEIISAPSLIYS